MTDINRVFMVGRLTKDAVLTYTTGGLAVLTFSLAVNRSVKKNDEWTIEASFFEVHLLGKIAETLKQYLVKGKRIAVDGELRQDRWTYQDKAQSKIYIVADNVEMLDGLNSEHKENSKFKVDVEQVAKVFNGEVYEQNEILF